MTGSPTKGSFADIMHTSFLSNNIFHEEDDPTNDGSVAYHSVRGDKRLGIIIDPGAAKGLGGTETLRE
eukprot:2390937-Pyramimonas_sp.AAC.1